MRLKLTLTLVLLAALASTGTAQTQKQPVLVELFTSEGCSDCPPADILLKKLSEDQPFPSIEVIALEEHVDYWNHGGWFDPFSSSDFTLRQNDYAGRIPKSSVYTPQMVVDGHAQFIGSRANEAVQQIQSAAAQPKARLILSATGGPTAHAYSVDVRLDPTALALPASNLDLYVAVTQKGLHSAPNAGENSGAALVHGPVVRQLKKIHSVHPSSNSLATALISVNEKWTTSDLALVAFVVDPKSHKVQAAGSAPIH